MIRNTNWDKRFIELSEHVSNWSKDTPKVGCTIVDQYNKVLSTGYNGMPSWFDDEHLLEIEDLKPHLITHAEINALNCLSKEHYNKELVFYITKPPCIYCATSIAYSCLKVKKVYYVDNTSEHFKTKYKLQESLDLFLKRGILVEKIVIE